MSDIKEQTLAWNQFWNFIAKDEHSKDEAEEGMKKVEEVLNKYILEELKSEKHFALQLEWYHNKEIPNFYRVLVNLIVFYKKPFIERSGEPGSPFYLSAGSGTKPPNPPNPGPPNPVFANSVIGGNSVFSKVIGDNQFELKNVMSSFHIG